MLLAFGVSEAQFQGDGSFHAGSFFKLTPSGRVNGNLIFSKPTDQNSGIIRGSSLGLEFLTYSSGTWHQRMTIDPGGSIGVGITTPATTLHVKHLTNQVVTNFESGDPGSYINIIDSNSGSFGAMIGALGDDLLLSPNNVERIRILSNGKVGIGTSDPGGHSSASPTLKLQVNGDIAVNRGYMLSVDHSWQTHGYLKYDDSILKARFKHSGYYGHRFDDNGGTRMVILQGGNVGIGTTTPESKLAVDGQIRATEVKVLTDVNSVPDYVFEPGYQLRTLEETKQYITENKHLPEIPSAAEIGENGIDLGDMNMRLLKKIEELTLHLIEQNERMEKMENELQALKK